MVCLTVWWACGVTLSEKLRDYVNGKAGDLIEYVKDKIGK
jgi:hypothetical protein